MNNIDELIKNELDFCNEIECEKNKFNQFIYESQNKKCSINLPFILNDYKNWLIEKGFVKETE